MLHAIRSAPALLIALYLGGATLAGEPIKDRANFIPARKHQPLKGTAIGVLVYDGQPVLSTEGRSGPADQLCFGADGCSYRWVYVPTLDQAQIKNLRVPVGEKEN